MEEEEETWRERRDPGSEHWRLLVSFFQRDIRVSVAHENKTTSSGSPERWSGSWLRGLRSVYVLSAKAMDARVARPIKNLTMLEGGEDLRFVVDEGR